MGRADEEGAVDRNLGGNTFRRALRADGNGTVHRVATASGCAFLCSAAGTITSLFLCTGLAEIAPHVRCSRSRAASREARRL